MEKTFKDRTEKAVKLATVAGMLCEPLEVIPHRDPVLTKHDAPLTRGQRVKPIKR